MLSRCHLPILLLALSIPLTALGQGTPEIPLPPPPAPEPERESTPAPDEPEADEPEDETFEAPPAAPTSTPERTRSNAAPRPELTVQTPPTREPAKKKSAGRLAVSPSGETGLLRVASAESMAPGLIRLSFGIDFFSVGSFITDNDDHSRVGATIGVSGSPIDYLELWLNTRAQSNRNNGTTPQLLQSQGDVTLGVKGFYPLADIMTLGLDMQLTFLSGVGQASFDFSATQFQMRALFTSDLMRATGKLPLRAHLNFGFIIDNSSKLLTGALTNAERFALGISDFHRFGIGLGVEVPVKYVTPYLEYTIEFPFDYLATPGIVIASSALRSAQAENPDVASDVARPAVQRALPQRITPGVRITAIPELTLDLAVEIGITPAIATGVMPTPPYNVWLLASYPLDPFGEEDVVAGPPVSIPVIVPEEVEPPPSTGQITGVVRNKNDGAALEGAIIAFDRSSPVATGSDGRFRSLDMTPGPVKLTVKREGFEPGTAELEVAVGSTAELDVGLVPAIREGLVRGRVVGDKDKALGSVPVLLEGPTRTTIQTQADGSFEVKAIAGKYSLVVDQPDYLKKSRDFELRGGETFTTELIIRPRPKAAVAEVKGDRILIKKRVHFVTGEARLTPDSEAILDNVVDLLVAHKQIKKLRIEGHTDNVGNETTNLNLSKARAEAVAKYLADQGIDATRLMPEGYGSSRPIAPNLTRRGREQNRRVEFHILEQ